MALQCAWQTIEFQTNTDILRQSEHTYAIVYNGVYILRSHRG